MTWPLFCVVQMPVAGSSRTLPLASIPNRAVTSPPTRATTAKARLSAVLVDAVEGH